MELRINRVRINRSRPVLIFFFQNFLKEYMDVFILFLGMKCFAILEQRIIFMQKVNCKMQRPGSLSIHVPCGLLFCCDIGQFRIGKKDVKMTYSPE